MTDLEPPVLVSTADRVTTVTLHRPAVRNALDTALMQALWDAVAAAGADPDVDVVVLTGSDPAFCAGVDLAQSPESAPAAFSGPGRGEDGLFRFLPPIDKPIIGAVNGAAVTGGLEVALQCTFLVASERARFADTHARIGVMPGGGITVSLAATVGLRKAIELSLTGNFLTATEALRLGLVNHVVPHDDLLPFAHRLALDIANNNAAAVRTLLLHYRRVADAATLSEAQELEGILAESHWDATRLGAARTEVTRRGRAQLHRPAD